MDWRTSLDTDPLEELLRSHTGARRYRRPEGDTELSSPGVPNTETRGSVQDPISQGVSPVAVGNLWMAVYVQVLAVQVAGGVPDQRSVKEPEAIQDENELARQNRDVFA